MCGRFCLTKPAERIAGHFELQIPYELQPRYNIAPGQLILAIMQDGKKQPEAAMFHWGLIPPWAKDPSISYKMVNARSETVATKPSFHKAYQSRHCLIPADGFYEWRTRGGIKQPYLFFQRDGQPFALAGLWERWTDPRTKETLSSCTILTTAANELVAPVHQRMPVVIPAAHRHQWLDASQDSSERLEPCEWPDFVARPVSTYVNNAAHEGEQCQFPPAGTSSLFS